MQEKVFQDSVHNESPGSHGCLTHDGGKDHTLWAGPGMGNRVREDRKVPGNLRQGEPTEVPVVH